MSRTGTLVLGALIFALAAAGVLVWTNNIDLSGKPPVATPEIVPASAPAPQPPSREAQLVTAMNEAAVSGGFAVSFKEGDVGKWKLADGHRLERFSLESAGPVFARLSSSAPLEWTSNQWPTQGLSVLIPRQFAEISNGRTVEVGFVARMAPTNGSPRITALYATQQAGNSQWKSIVLKPQFEMYKFTYDVPALEGGYSAEPILVFHSDPTGSGHAVELIGAYVKVVP